MEPLWYYASDNQQKGPVPASHLLELAQRGQLRPGDLVWREGMPNWVEAEKVRGLFGPQGDVELGTATPPPAAAPAPPPPPHAPPPAGPMPVDYRGTPQQPWPMGYQTPPQGPPPPNYLVQAILVTVLCCLPFGIVAIIFAAQVNSKYQAGDYGGALDASNKARIWSWVAFGVGIVPAIFIILANCLGIAGGL